MPIKNSEKIIEDLSSFFEKNETYTRKEFLEYAKEVYDNNFKKTKKVVDENAEKKPLNAYQLFMKEQRVILKKRENEKNDGSEKMKSTEIFKEIAGMWKLQKSRIEAKPDENKLEKIDEEPKEEEKLKISNDEEPKEEEKLKISNDEEPKEEEKLKISNDEEQNEAKLIEKKSKKVSKETGEKPKKKNGKWVNI